MTVGAPTGLEVEMNFQPLKFLSESLTGNFLKEKIFYLHFSCSHQKVFLAILTSFACLSSPSLLRYLRSSLKRHKPKESNMTMMNE